MPEHLARDSEPSTKVDALSEAKRHLHLIDAKLELSARSFREIGEVFSSLANGTSLKEISVKEISELVVDLKVHLVLYCQMVTIGKVCPFDR